MNFKKDLDGSAVAGSTPSSAGTIRTKTLLAYSLPHLAAVLLLAPTNILQGIYAKYFGLPLAVIAGVILFARMFDGLTDPLVGYFSDRQRALSGTRKPFMIAGGIIYAIGGYLLYSPPADVGALYLACAFMVFHTGWTLLEIPYVAWGGELAGSSLEKTKVYSYRAAVGYAGLLLFYTIPLLPFFPTTDITPETLRWAAIASGLLMLPALYISMRHVPDGHAPGEVRGRQARGFREGVASWVRLFTANRPFLFLMGAYLTGGVAAAMWYGMVFLYVDSYLGLGAQFAQMFMLSFAIGVACTPLWYKIAARAGIKPTWCLAIFMMTASFIYTYMLEPGETTFTQLLILKVINTLAYVALSILVPSMLAGIVDYGTWKFGANQGGSYFAVYAFVQKLNIAVGGALALAIAGWYGFDPAASVQTERGTFGMFLGIVWIPIALEVVSCALVLLIPFNVRRHAIVRRRLAAREIRIHRRDADANKGALQPKELPV